MKKLKSKQNKENKEKSMPANKQAINKNKKEHIDERGSLQVFGLKPSYESSTVKLANCISEVADC